MERRLRVEILVSAGEHGELEVFEGGKGTEPSAEEKGCMQDKPETA